VTAPHLRSAFELDDALIKFSDSLAEQKLDVLISDQQLDKIMDLFEFKYLADLNLWQYYVYDVKSNVAEFREKWTTRHKPVLLNGLAVSKTLQTQAIELEQKAGKNNGTYKRYAKVVNLHEAIQYMELVCSQMSISDVEAQVLLFQEILDEVNLKYYREYDADKAIILQGVKTRARFLRLEDHGPLLGPISSSYIN
jgi:glycogen debranching enzyme